MTTTTATTMDIRRADSELKTMATDLINGILAEDGRRERVAADQVNSLGCLERGWNRALYFMNTKEFTIAFDLVDTGKPKKPVEIKIAVDSGHRRRVSKTIRV